MKKFKSICESFQLIYGISKTTDLTSKYSPGTSTDEISTMKAKISDQQDKIINLYQKLKDQNDVIKKLHD